MSRKVCGTDKGVEFRNRSGMALCPGCHRSTPSKVSREEFERRYWGADVASVPESTRREFWEDYRVSQHGSVEDYLVATTSH